MPEQNVNSIFFSGNTDYYMTITKTDIQGTWAKTVYLDTLMLDHRMIETRDSGVLLAAYVDTMLLILKFNNNLQLLWGKKIPMGADILKLYGRNTVDIEQGRDSTGHEVFYILSGTPTYHTSYLNSDAAFSVVKIRDNGQLLFHKKYADLYRLSESYMGVIDMPYSLTPIDSSKNHFLIAGMRYEQDSSSAYSPQYLYFMTIDQYGNIVTNYNRIKTEDDNPDCPEVVWDDHKHVYACCYNEYSKALLGNSNMFNGIGLLRLNYSLNPINAFLYFLFPYNYANSITITGGGDYLIGGSKSNYTMPSFTNPLFLKINAATYVPIFSKRYNWATNVVNGSFHRTDAYDNNYMIPFVNDANYGFQLRPRMIVADLNGSACGELSDSMKHQDYDPQEHHFYYTWREFNTIHDYNPQRWEDNLAQDSCDGNNNPDYYRQAPTNFVSNTVSINPTIITGNTEQVMCKYQLVNVGNLQVVVNDVLGREIYRQIVSAQTNEGNFEIPANVLGNGLNIVRVYADNKLLNVTKLMKE